MLHRNDSLHVLACGLCVRRKGGTGGGAWGHPQGDMQMVAARLGYEKVMVGTGWATSRPECMHGQAYKTPPSPCRGLISGKEGCSGL